MKQYWLNVALITLSTLFATSMLVKVTEIDISQAHIMRIVALADLCITALLVHLHHQSVRINLLQAEIGIERMRQDARYQELKEEAEKLRNTVVAGKINESLSKKFRQRPNQ